MTVIGKPMRRLEDPRLLRGEARFIDDIKLANMAEAAFVRSPNGHALIKGIDASAALALPGVVTVLTMDDLRPHLMGEHLVVGLPSEAYKQDRNRPALCRDEAVYVGEPVAIVVAENRYIAEDAVDLVAVDYDILPASSDCRAALTPGAPPVHRDGTDNLLAEIDMEYGDVEAAFAAAAHVFGESIWQHRGGGHSIECRGMVAHYDKPTDKLVLWNSTQMAHASLRVLVDMLGRDENRVRVVTPDIGGGFGPKLVIYQEEVVVSIASIVLGRPVKWIEDRREHFMTSTQERDQYWEVEVAVDDAGGIQGIRGSIVHDHGAYTARGINLPQNSGETLPGPYVVPAYRMNIRLALTNKVPVTPVRGAGHPQACFAMERLLDQVARELGLDRAEVRRRNLIPAESMPYTKPLKSRGGAPVVLDSGDFPASQQAALDKADWSGFGARQQAALRDGRYIGIGIANFVKGTGRGPFEEVTVRIGTSGRVQVYTGAAAIGQGTETMLAQIVAEELGGDVANITVTTGDTARNSLGIGTSNSRVTVVAGSSAHAAARKVRDKALLVASHLLELPVEELEIVGAEIRAKGADERRRNLWIALADVANAVAGTPGYSLPSGVEPGLEATERLLFDAMPYVNGTAVAEVEVDPHTGGVEILSYIMTHDCGRMINPMIVNGQVIGGAVHGIGNALFEWMQYDESAQPLTTNYADYLLVTATELPRIEVVHTETLSPLNDLGVKGVGECGVIPAAAVLASAIEDALTPFDVRIARAPITPPDILALIQQSGRG